MNGKMLKKDLNYYTLYPDNPEQMLYDVYRIYDLHYCDATPKTLTASIVQGKNHQNKNMFCKLFKIGDYTTNINARDHLIIYEMYNFKNQLVGEALVSSTPDEKCSHFHQFRIIWIGLKEKYTHHGNGTILLSKILNDINEFKQKNNLDVSITGARFNSKEAKKFYKKFKVQITSNDYMPEMELKDCKPFEYRKICPIKFFANKYSKTKHNITCTRKNDLREKSADRI